MIKREELTNPNSCLGRARIDEMLFVLLARDVAAPSTIRHWVQERIARGKNTQDDAQIKEALYCAEYMERLNNSQDRLNIIRIALRERLKHTLECAAQVKESNRCLCGVYSAQNYFEQLVVDYQIGMPKQPSRIFSPNYSEQTCNICNRPDCDTPNQKH